MDVYSYGVLCWEMMTGQEPWGSVADPKEIVGCSVLSSRARLIACRSCTLSFRCSSGRLCLSILRLRTHWHLSP